MPTFRMRDGSGSIRLKHVIEDTDRHGNVRVYLRRPGHLKVRLRSQPGTEDFLAEYRAAMMGATPRAGRTARAARIEGQLQVALRAVLRLGRIPAAKWAHQVCSARHPRPDLREER